MTPRSKRKVLIGSCWRRQDPSGAWQTFEVSSFSLNPFGQRCAKARWKGRAITLNVVAMENGDPRFEHVHDDYVRSDPGLQQRTKGTKP